MTGWDSAVKMQTRYADYLQKSRNPSSPLSVGTVFVLVQIDEEVRLDDKNWKVERRKAIVVAIMLKALCFFTYTKTQKDRSQICHPCRHGTFLQTGAHSIYDRYANVAF